MAKKITSVVIFNICMIAFGLFMYLVGPLSLKFSSLDVGPIKFGISVSFAIFFLGLIGYVDHSFITYLSTVKIRTYKVKEQVIKDLADARNYLRQANYENSNLTKWIEECDQLISGFQDKINIVKKLLAIHGENYTDWNWIQEGTDEAQAEVIKFVQKVLDTAVVFNNENYTQANLSSAIENIQSSNNDIREILKKYDEFISLVQKVLENKLHSSASVVINSLDLTIKSVKQVYGIDQVDPIEELVKKYTTQPENSGEGVQLHG